MLYNVNVILYKLLYRKQLLVEVHTHLIYRFYLTGQFVDWNFGKFRFSSHAYWNLYVSDTKINALFKLMKTITKGFRFIWKHNS